MQSGERILRSGRPECQETWPLPPNVKARCRKSSENDYRCEHDLPLEYVDVAEPPDAAVVDSGVALHGLRSGVEFLLGPAVVRKEVGVSRRWQES